MHSINPLLRIHVKNIQHVVESNLYYVIALGTLSAVRAESNVSACFTDAPVGGDCVYEWVNEPFIQPICWFIQELNKFELVIE